MIETISVKKFAASSPDLYEAFKTYAQENFSEVSKDAQEEAINFAYIAEIENRTGMKRENALSEKKWAANPIVKEMADEIRSFLIDMVLPETLLTSAMSHFVDFRFADLGDSMTFNLENNALYSITKAGYRKRKADMQKLYTSTVTLVPENRAITVGTDLFEILSGRVSIAKEVMKAVRSIETAVYFDAYTSMKTAVDAIANSNLTHTNPDEEDIIHMAEVVTAYNQGRKPIILGTPVALKRVVPSNTAYRYLLESDFVKLGYIKTFNGYDVVALEQVADPYNATAYSLKLADDRIYIVSPGADKLVKVGFGGEMMSHSDDFYDNANLLTLTTLNKAWDTQVITNSVAAVGKFS